MSLCSYKCIGLRRFHSDENAVKLFAANEERLTDQYNCNDGSYEECFDWLQNGSQVVHVCDLPENCKYSVNKRLTTLASQLDVKTFCFDKDVNVSASLLTTSEPNVTYLSDGASIVFIKEYQEKEAAAKFETIFVSLKHCKIKKFKFNIVDEDGKFGSHTLSMHSSQLFICYNAPVKIYVVNFGYQNVSLSSWSSKRSVPRFLTCENVVVVIDNHKHPEYFLCVTFVGNQVHELMVKKPEIFLRDDSYELPALLNIKGRLIWVAQNDNNLKLLSLCENKLTVLKCFDFNFGLKKNEQRMQVKKVKCWRNSLLFIPLFCMASNVDCSVATGYEIIVLNMLELKILYVLKADCILDIFTDTINTNILNNGCLASIRISQRTSGGEQKIISVNHFNLQPNSLQELCLRKTIHETSDFMQHFNVLNNMLLQYYHC